MNTLQHLIYTIKLLLRNWWRIGLTCIVVGALSAVYIFSLPRSYQSEVIMIPEVSSGSSSGGGLSGLAKQMAGISVGGSSPDAIYPEFYPKVLSTPEFLCSLFHQRVTPTGSRTSMTLFDYLTKHQESAWWSKYFEKSEEEVASKEGTLSPDMNPQRLTRRQFQLVKFLGGSIASFVDKRTDMVTIDVMMQDAEVAAQVATMVQEKLQEYIVEYRTRKARNDVEYMEGITEQALEEYKKAQKEYAAFVDANQDLVLTSMRQEEERLENEMQLAYDTYSHNAQQLRTAKDKVQERTPAFTILQPAGVPVKPVKPKRVVFVAMMLVLTFFASAIWIIARDVMRRAGRKEEAQVDNPTSPDSLAEAEGQTEQ
ncbi:MAG: chain-length determining protein [Alloprevotella sp.]|nr:chain-length determining protein [Alloprevotella sp.]MBR1652433.1 chain-length determining protein [Alloprevotella sp.]